MEIFSKDENADKMHMCVHVFKEMNTILQYGISLLLLSQCISLRYINVNRKKEQIRICMCSISVTSIKMT